MAALVHADPHQAAPLRDAIGESLAKHTGS